MLKRFGFGNRPSENGLIVGCQKGLYGRKQFALFKACMVAQTFGKLTVPIFIVIIGPLGQRAQKSMVGFKTCTQGGGNIVPVRREQVFFFEKMLFQPVQMRFDVCLMVFRRTAEDAQTQSQRMMVVVGQGNQRGVAVEWFHSSGFHLI